MGLRDFFKRLRGRNDASVQKRSRKSSARRSESRQDVPDLSADFLASSGLSGERGTQSSGAFSDPALSQKKRARRRLIGAAALVLGAVVLLPMIFDSEPKPTADDIDIQIPDRDTPFNPSVPMPHATDSGAVSATVSPPSDPPVSSASPQSALSVAPAALAVPAHSAPQPVAPQPTKPVSKAADKPVAKENTKAAKDTPPDSTKTVDKPKAAKATDVAALKPAKDIKSAKPSADDSARALALLEGKHDGARNIVPKDGAKDGAKDSSKESGKNAGRYIVQIGAFSSTDKVKDLRDKASAAGLHVYTEKLETSQGERIRVRVGPFASHDEAENARAKLVSAGLPGSLVHEQ